MASAGGGSAGAGGGTAAPGGGSAGAGGGSAVVDAGNPGPPTTDGGFTVIVASTAFSDADDFAGIDSRTLRAGDVDGDGLGDLCGRRSNGIACARGDGVGGFGPLTQWLATDFFDSTGWGAEKYALTLRLADLDGDGKADVCLRGTFGVTCAQSQGSGFATASVRTNDFSDAQGYGTTAARYESFQLGDLNGDGKADVCARNGEGLRCALNDGLGHFAAATTWSALFPDAEGWGQTKFGATLRLFDLDADGKADVCARGQAGIWCARSLGNRFDSGAAVANPFPDVDGWGALQHAQSFSVADVNGDGRGDFCARGVAGLACAFGSATGYVSGGTVVPAFSDADGFSSVELGASVVLGRLDGDAKADACIRSRSGVRCALSRSEGVLP